MNQLYDTVIEESETRFFIFTVRSTLRFLSGERPGLSQLTADHRGNYTCAFENQARRIESNMALTVERQSFSEPPLGFQRR